MKHLDSPEDDLFPIYIFLLLFSIFLLAFLTTTDLKNVLPNPAHSNPSWQALARYCA